MGQEASPGLPNWQGGGVSQEGLIALNEGQESSAADIPGASRTQINWMVDTEGNVRLRPAISSSTLFPGTYNRTSGTSTGILDMYVWRNVSDRREYLVYVRQDRTIWALDLLLGTTIALSTSDPTTQLDGSASKVVFTEDTQRLVMAGGGQLQVWQPPATVSARLGNYVAVTNQVPLSATHVVSLANYLVANEVTPAGLSGQIFWSGLGDGNHRTGWSALNFNTADADPDSIVALAGNLRELYAFGTKTLQVFGIGSDPTLPFTSSIAIALGCGAPYSVVRVDDQFAMLDDRRRLVFTNGRSYTVISDDIVKLIRDLTTVSDAFGFRVTVGFWDLIVWVFPTDGKAYAYDRRLQKWFQWRGFNGVDDFAGVRISSSAYWQAGNMTIVGDPLYENLWTLDIGVYSDTGPGLPILAERITERTDWGSAQRKACRKVRFFAKRGLSSTTTPYLAVAKRDDDGPWQESNLSLGALGDYTSFVDWYPGGIYRRRQFRLRYSSGVDVAITRAVEFWDAVGE